MNKKILMSLGVIAAVSAVTIGATMSYFSDTETSSGNIFTAGSLDLKVDHLFASYNGEECNQGDCVPTGSNLILNDGFEGPPIVTHPTGWDIFDNGTAGLGWSVEWVNSTTPYGGYDRPAVAKIEFHKNGNLPDTSDIPNGWIAHSGQQYIELDSDWNGHVGTLNNEPALARIYQDITTVAGTKYELRYWHSYRPGVADNTMKVKVDGNLVRTVTANGSGQTSTSWAQYIDKFTATDSSTRIEFEGAGLDDSLGIFLDDVTLYELTCDYQIPGGTCTLWELKDLGEDDYFWNFTDVKPGDWGINIISLHAFDNDAFACLITHDIVDAEDTVNQPEIDAGDDIASIIGELSQFIKIFVWEDVNENNVYDAGEDILVSENSPLTERTTAISLTASNTKNIGLAWCAGTQSLSDSDILCDGSSMGNIAQTDILTAAITAYAEQQRNNLEFDCADVVLP